MAFRRRALTDIEEVDLLGGDTSEQQVEQSSSLPETDGSSVDRHEHSFQGESGQLKAVRSHSSSVDHDSDTHRDSEKIEEEVPPVSNGASASVQSDSRVRVGAMPSTSRKRNGSTNRSRRRFVVVGSLGCCFIALGGVLLWSSVSKEPSIPGAGDAQPKASVNEKQSKEENKVRAHSKASAKHRGHTNIKRRARSKRKQKKGYVRQQHRTKASALSSTASKVAAPAVVPVRSAPAYVPRQSAAVSGSVSSVDEAGWEFDWEAP